MITFDIVRQIGLSLPDVEESTSYGSPSLKVRGKMFACIAIHSSAEPDTLGLRIGMAQRDELISADPETYYLTPHYVDYPIVLVRLRRVHSDALRDLIAMAWKFVSSSKPRRARPRKRSTR
jgi:hypothetical protein